ncbi:MAG: hypothetical protein ACR2HQ_15900 [Ilumatobacteraceae bacterium]
MDVERYRKRYEAELAAKADAPRRRRAAGALRSTAAGGVSAAVRADAIRTAPIDEDDLAGRVEELLATLLDRKEPVAVRLAALQALGVLDFLGPRFSPFRADYKQALRELATDPRATVRESALELLAIDRDPYAQDLLVRGLERPKEAVVSEAKALQFLGYDDHADFAPLARRVYKRAKGAAREESLRMLATDPQSERLFTRLLKDKAETSSIRQISASGLQSLNPAAFERTARRIVADDDDFNEIRATSLAALAHGREAGEKPPDQKFIDTVQNLTTTTRSSVVRASSRQFLRSNDG